VGAEAPACATAAGGGGGGIEVVGGIGVAHGDAPARPGAKTVGGGGKGRP
jgi:hypothetical protein